MSYTIMRMNVSLGFCSKCDLHPAPNEACVRQDLYFVFADSGLERSSWKDWKPEARNGVVAERTSGAEGLA